ncbi:MAG TPA: hypothetical protein VEB68_12560 [Croceibacterium sp.]|nr:hypothetical protein [Croceibacterium sp.]
METLIVVAAVLAVGVVGAVATVGWALYVKPRLRRRYERNHHRSKRNGTRKSSR